MYRPDRFYELLAEMPANRNNTVEFIADAMLKALKKEGQHFTKQDINDGHEVSHWDPPTAGTWVFLPDESDKSGDKA